MALVVNHGAPLWDETTRWRLKETLRIGVGDGPAEYMFGAVGDMGILSDGRLVVADPMARQLRVYTPDGRWEQTIGRPGSGPGEFGSRGLTVLVGPGDTLLVLDPGNQRANLIEPRGNWLASWRSAPGESPLGPAWMARDWLHSPEGRIASHMSRIPGPQVGQGDTMDVVLLRGLHGSARGTAGVVPASRLRRNSGSGFEFWLYAGEPSAALCPDNTLIVGRGDRYKILRFAPSGRLEQIVGLERPNAVLTEGEQAFLRRRFREIYLDNGFAPARVDQLVAGMHFTETYPAFVTVACGPDGSVWVMPARLVRELSPEEKETFWVGPSAEASPVFDVFDRGGHYLGQVPLPDSFWPRRFHGDRLYGRWRDSLDVEYVKVFEIDRNTG
ncbi:MAG: hypothetical protein P8174_09955 [Gemmatimonadota bacterium]